MSADEDRDVNTEDGGEAKYKIQNTWICVPHIPSRATIERLRKIEENHGRTVADSAQALEDATTEELFEIGENHGRETVVECDPAHQKREVANCMKDMYPYRHRPEAAIELRIDPGELLAMLKKNFPYWELAEEHEREFRFNHLGLRGIPEDAEVIAFGIDKERQILCLEIHSENVNAFTIRTPGAQACAHDLTELMNNQAVKEVYGKPPEPPEAHIEQTGIEVLE